MRKSARFAIGLSFAFAFIVILALAKREAERHRPTGVFAQTYISINPEKPLSIPPLVMANGSLVLPAMFQGHWSVIFFGFTTCPLVCPKTLALLATIAHKTESGVQSGATQLIFVSVDPERDRPKILESYLNRFTHRIVGLSGTRDVIDRFSKEIGAGYQPAGPAIDHSTSLFVVDPKGRLAGILLRPSNSARILDDLARLRRSYAAEPSLTH